MSASDRPLDDPEKAARIDRYTSELISHWPPLTEDQKVLIATVLGGRRNVLRGGEHAA